MNDPDGVQVGDDIPSWTMESVDPARMRTMAAILRDPYPVHWDRDGNAAIGLPGRVINQGPLNLGYVVNMLLAWAGPACVRRLSVSFGRPVLDGDRVTAGGRVTDVSITDDEQRATCDVWLDRDGEHVVTGTAVVTLGPAPSDRSQVQSHD
jgi:acyl dehydratase